MASTPTPPCPAQHQERQPGIESQMNPQPVFDNPDYVGSGKLKDKVAVITGGDSGQGRAIAVAFAKEGADIVIVYLNEHDDAAETKRHVEQKGRRCLTTSWSTTPRSSTCRAVWRTFRRSRWSERSGPIFSRSST